MSLIKLENVTKVYHTGEVPVTALKGIDLEIGTQAFVSFIGPSGSGKSTLLNLIGALDKPTAGTITVNGANLGALSRKDAANFRGETLGFVFQNFNLIPVLTVYENVEYPLLMIRRLPAKERRERILNLLDKVGMLDQKGKYPNQISGGQKQRVAVARALVTNPQIVLADEPTANLDHATAFKVIAIMHEMQKEFGTTLMQNYLYARITKPEPFDWLYFTPSLYTIYNLHDNSFLLATTLSYKPVTNFEFIFWPTFLLGGNHTEFGGKLLQQRVELWMRVYF